MVPYKNYYLLQIKCMVSNTKMVLNQTKVKHYLHLMYIIILSWQQLSKKLHLHLAAVQHFLHLHVHVSMLVC